MLGFSASSPRHLNLTVTYLGNKGTHMFAGTGPSYNPNQIAVGPGTDFVTCTAAITPCPTGDAVAPGFSGLQSPNNRRPFNLNGVPMFQYPGSTYTTAGGTVLPTPACCAVDLSYFGNDASNEYESLQISAEKRVSYGLQFLAHYTFSHSYGYDSNYYTVDPRIAFGPNPYNRNQVFLISTIYDLPIGRGKRFLSDAGRAMDLLVGGWQISNTTTYGTGLPFTPSIGECGLISDAGPCRPNVTGKLATGVTHANGNTYWFTPVAPLAYPQAELNVNVGTRFCPSARPVSGPLSRPVSGQIGNMGASTPTGGLHAFYDDISLQKTFNITERYKAQFRFACWLPLQPSSALRSRATPASIAWESSAGQITDIEADSAPGAPIGMRQLQFGSIFIF